MELMPFRVRLMLMPQEYAAQVWNLAEPFLKAAEAQRSLQSVSEWLGDCINGRAQLWLVWSDVDVCEGAGITRLTEGPSGKVCIIEAFGAKRGDDSLLETVEAWAKTQGCDRIRVFGRKGWMKRLKTYKPIGIILDKDL